MSSPPQDPVARAKALEREVAELRQEVARLQAMLGLREQTAARAPAAPDGAPAAPQKPLRILLADDHPVQAKLTQSLLGALGYSADWVRNGQEVLYALEKRPYDVVLMDVQMPLMNGFEATAAIRERWPVGKRPRLIGLTARNLDQDRRDCLAAGMDDFIGKPASLRVLAAKLAGRSGTLVDRRVLEALSEATSRATVAELVDMFARDLPVTIQAMRQAVATNDGRALQNLAHPQVSVCHALGITSLSVLARQLETLGETNQLSTAPQLLDDLESLLTPVEAELRAWVQPAKPEPAPAAVAVPRVLVVEDNPVNLKIAVSLLEGMGLRAESAGSGHGALEALGKASYGAVLMDILLPGMNGLATTREICRRWPREKRPPIIGMTGLDSEADRQAGLEAGMDDYIVKPLKRHVLEAKLRRFNVLSSAPSAAPRGAAQTAPTVVAAPASRVLDPGILRQWAQRQPALAVELLDDFLEGLTPLLADIRKAVQERNAALLHRAAHSLKSSSIAVGAVDMATLAAELETDGRQGAVGSVAPKAERLLAMHEPLFEALQGLRRQLTESA